MHPWSISLLVTMAIGGYLGRSEMCRADDGRVCRIAIVALDASQEVQAAVPLLTAWLTTNQTVQLVERADLERILSEQHLSLSGLADPGRQLHVGQLLRADGLVLLSKDSVRGSLALRMAETRQGFRVSLISYPLANRKLADVIREIQGDLLNSLPKLSLDPAQCLLLSVAAIGNATMIPEAAWIETELAEAIEQGFSRYPRVLILERRQLGRLMEESQVAGQTTNAFRADGVIIDGELALTKGVPLDPKTPDVTFSLRFRNAMNRELGQVSVRGVLNDKETLVARILAAAVVNIRALGKQTESSPQEEAKLWLNFAQRGGSWNSQQGIWGYVRQPEVAFCAVESAYALDPMNADAQGMLIGLLIRKGAPKHDPHPKSRCCKTRDESGKEHADTLVRAYEVYRAAPSARLRRPFAAICKPGLWWEHGYLYQDISRDNPEIINRLKPVRETILRGVEDEGSMYMLGYGSLNFCDEPIDQITYTQDVLQRTLVNTSATARVASLTDYFSGMWRFNQYPAGGTYLGLPIRGAPIRYSDRPSIQNAWNRFYQGLRSSPEPAAAFLACYYLANMEPPAAELQALVREALAAGERVADPVPGAFTELYAQFCFDFSKDPQVLFKACLNTPSMAQKLYALTNIFQQVAIPDASCQQLIASAQDLYEKSFWHKNRYGEMVRVNNPYYGTDKLLDELKGKHSLPARASNESSAAGSAYPGTDATAAGNNERVLFSTSWPEWRKRVRLLQQPDAPGSVNGCIVPQRLLLDGSNLWIGAGGYIHHYEGTSAAWPGVGLVHLELPSGRIVSVRVGEATRSGITSMRRWDDTICVGQSGLGVHLFPVAASGQDPGLDGVRLLAKQDGLVELTIRALTTIDSDLFIACQNSIVGWNRKTGKARLLLNIRDRQGAAALNSPDLLTGLTSHKGRRDLYVIAMHLLGHISTIWKQTLSDQKWDPIITNTNYLYSFAGHCHEFQPGQVIIDAHGGLRLGQKGFFYLTRFDVDSEVLTGYDTKKFSSLLPPVPPGDIQEAVEYNNGLIAIVGSGPDLRVSCFPGINFQSAIFPPNTYEGWPSRGGKDVSMTR